MTPNHPPTFKFGTDGWRAKMGEEFSHDNVRLVSQAFAEYLLEQGGASRGIAIGYDNRFESEHFARTAAEVCSGAGIKTFLSKTAVSSPTISFTVNDNGLAAGIMITASHNPPDWNGFKIKEAFGGSAFPATTKAVEEKITPTLRIKPNSDKIVLFDPRPGYWKKIASLVDLELIKSSKLKIVIDPMFGSGSGYFTSLGLPVTEIRSHRDPLFGGINPEPIPVNLEETFSYTAETALKYSSELTACIVLDGDADRLAAVDATGQFINTHNVFSLLLHHLIVHKKLPGSVVKTFNLSNLIDKLCAKHGRKLQVTPIGFKYIADLMLKEDVLLGGEESGGMGIRGFIPERDGVLAGLNLLELMAYEKRTLGQILESLMNEFGHFYYNRADLHTPQAQAIVSELKAKTPTEFAGKKIAKVETLDGLKFSFADEGWILFRASGTEPLLRVYVEGRSPDDVKQVLGAGEKLVAL